MKNLILISIVTMLMVACGNSKTKSVTTGNNTDAVVTEESVEQTKVAKHFIMTKDGVGSLKMKQPFKDMSQSGEGLYNKVKKEPFYDEPSGITFQLYTLYLEDVKVAGFMIEHPNSPIEELTVTSPNVSLMNGIKIGMTIREAMAVEGVKAKASYDEVGDLGVGAMIEVKSEGIAFGDYYWGGKEISAKGKAKFDKLTMENNTIDLLPEDFKPEARVDYLIILH